MKEAFEIIKNIDLSKLDWKDPKAAMIVFGLISISVFAISIEDIAKQAMEKGYALNFDILGFKLNMEPAING